MKKLIYLFVAFAFLSCEKKANEETTLTNEAMTPATFDCEELKKVRSLKPEEQIAWYKKNQHKLCEEPAFYECIRKFHSINNSDFEEAALSHARNSSGKISYRKIAASKLESILNTFNGDCYDKHVEFDLSKQPHEAGFIRFKNFAVDSSRYSIPLLKGIINDLKRNQINQNTEFEICSAVINNKKMVIFKVKNDYFNISHDPGILK